MFEYILKRGVSPLASNENDMNALHFAIKLEQIEFVSYLLEVDFNRYQVVGIESDIIKNKRERLLKLFSHDENQKKSNWKKIK